MRFPPIRSWVRRLRDDRRELGWRGLAKKHGWKPIILFVLFYLVRDVILYVLIPLAIWAGLFR